MPRHAWIARLSPRAQTAVLCATLSLGYCTTYLFTRPYFVLPDDYLNSTAGGLHGSPINRQSALALAQSLGYLFSKWPAVVLMSSAAFFRHRQRALAALFVVTAIVSGVGFAVFDAPTKMFTLCYQDKGGAMLTVSAEEVLDRLALGHVLCQKSRPT